jgi:hypothetical protein
MVIQIGLGSGLLRDRREHADTAITVEVLLSDKIRYDSGIDGQMLQRNIRGLST